MQKNNPAQNFKSGVYALTEHRIKLVMKYVIYCYLEMVKDGKKYDFSKKGRVQKEDFLRDGLVDDYLTKRINKDYYKKHISDNEFVEIYFQEEEKQGYTLFSKFAEDFIDISVKETKLSNILTDETEDEIKFAIECKRIKETRDYEEYVKDIQKFADRSFTTFRLPYEGQIAFIESSNITHTMVSDKINKKIKDSSTITTTQYLKSIKIHDSFDASFSSKHKRNYHKKEQFTIFHLLLNYSGIIVL